MRPILFRRLTKNPVLKVVLRVMVFAWRVAAFVSTIVAVLGLPDEYATLEGWILFFQSLFELVMDDARVTALAERAVVIAEFVNQPWVRVILGVIGLAGLFWGARPFWRFRHRLLFNWRRFLAEQVWIGREAAIKLIKASDWARLLEPETKTTPFIVMPETVGYVLGQGKKTGLTQAKKALLKFDLFIDRTLDAFANDNPHAVRQLAGEDQYDETDLRAFLKEATLREVEDEFGPVPSIKLK